MDRAAREVMDAHPDIVLAFGETDEYRSVSLSSIPLSPHMTYHAQYSFLRKSAQLYNRRHSKIATTLTSLFSSSYVFHWSSFFNPSETPLRYPPSFDGRIVLYPGEREVRDYFTWRQVDSESLFSSTPLLITRNGLTECWGSARQQSIQHGILGTRATRRHEHKRGSCNTERTCATTPLSPLLPR